MADVERPGAQRWVPTGGGIAALRAAAPGCRGCELWAPATQVVFSEGPAHARLMLVGEQPGDVEDREGEPFVGPAGRVLDQAQDGVGRRAGARRGEAPGVVRWPVLVTAHPSAVLRLRDRDARHAALDALAADLRVAAAAAV